MGVGLVLTENNEVNLVLMVGLGGEYKMAVPMDVLNAEAMVSYLSKMLGEARLVQEAVLTMPLESAKQYMENWAARQRT
jgi:hypothetical protein